MFKEILEIDFSQLKKIINNPSQFLQQEFSLDLSNNEIYFLAFVILLFIVGVSFEALKPKKMKFLIVIYQITTINRMKLHPTKLFRKLT